MAKLYQMHTSTQIKDPLVCFSAFLDWYTKKCNDTKKAERFFKERGIKYQLIDMKEKA